MSANLKNSTKTLKLNDGSQIPIVGLGTWQATDERDAYNAVRAALDAGYRHIDTAAIYKNEVQVGEAIRDSGVPREEIFVTTKLWNAQHHEPEVALDESLQRLGLDYVDLYLMHWPVSLDKSYMKESPLELMKRPDGTRPVETDWTFINTWELMQKLPKNKVRSIGVSNFSVNNLKDLLKAPTTNVVPTINQVELHPLLPQYELVDYCQQNKIEVEAYSPLGSTSAPLLSEPIVIDVAKKNGVQPAHVVLSWIVQRNIIVLPKSVHAERVAANLKTFTLPEEDFDAIGKISQQRGERRINNPNFEPFKTFV
ncbi:hypothetical protein KAFR_0E03840 [Kazachstania africana CBS 2517]|uniref:NADP-dependent oxidoreductase domain-containing protein n=1 Tax=Kazachstania africana (strain ATCC 22294 / BCRC 22015 / CBS 2517 / CECT 1963 / NBRC 1671 / NRRL Y-8276) TaxID=1071382 RepID=H2AVY5_KAZAF|nr:hypothetical protein KAFR_0E03840 [Kazachstania africana CBS 2517]CCF58535.1 hypothetical protein KAFR_0E03840 [Kazachstania africana CBS 2517]